MSSLSTETNHMLLPGEAFVAKFKREPTSPADCAWMNGYETATERFSGEPPAKPVAWIDSKGELHKNPRFKAFGVIDLEGSLQWSGCTFASAIDAWKALGEKAGSITGWNCGVIADNFELRKHFTEASGTFKCPICGVDTPHTHTDGEIQDHRACEKSIQRIRLKAWTDIEKRASDLERKFPPREPLYRLATTKAGDPS